MKPLVAIRQDLAELLLEIEQQGGEVMPQQEADLERIAAESVAQLALAQLDYKRMADEIRLKIDQAKKYRDALDFRIETLRGLQAKVMEQTGQDKIKTEYFSLSLQQGKGELSLAPGFELADVPELYRKQVTTWKLDTDACREALEAGVDLPFVRLEVRSHTSLRPTAAWRQAMEVRNLERAEVALLTNEESK